MAQISPGSKIVTLINTFTVSADKQDELIRCLDEATENVVKDMEGFISANIHKSLDGKKVANYAQWRSVEDLQAMLKNPKAKEHLKQAADLAESYEPIMYEVESSHDNDQAEATVAN